MHAWHGQGVGARRVIRNAAGQAAISYPGQAATHAWGLTHRSRLYQRLRSVHDWPALGWQVSAGTVLVLAELQGLGVAHRLPSV